MTREEFFASFKLHDCGTGHRAQVDSASGNFNLSIVAGDFFYCTPRENRASVTDYTAMELAIFSKKPDGKEAWATYDELNAAGVFPKIGLGEYDPERTEQSGVFGWVSVDDLIGLVNTL